MWIRNGGRSMIEFQHVTKRYGFDYALKDVSFTLSPGKIYGLLGPNGSGKSTTLKLIAGLVHPSNGSIIVNGKQVNRRIAEEVVYLSELDMFYDSFKVSDMVDYYATQFCDFKRDRAAELLRFMKLDPAKKIHSLSKGNRGRMKLALALARDASILLLDEPFSGLDPMVRDSIVTGLISYIDFDKQTVIMATHEISEVESLLDEVLAIQNGKIIGRKQVETLREEEGLSILDWMKQEFKDS